MNKYKACYTLTNGVDVASLKPKLASYQEAFMSAVMLLQNSSIPYPRDWDTKMRELMNE